MFFCFFLILSFVLLSCPILLISILIFFTLRLALASSNDTWDDDGLVLELDASNLRHGAGLGAHVFALLSY